MKPFYEKGRYICEMVNQGITKSKNTGTPQIVWRFLVLETENHEPVDAQYERTIYRAVTDKTMPYVLQDLQTLGFQYDSFKMIDPNTPGYQDFTGKQFLAFCSHEEYEGSTREKWGIANEGAAFEVTPLDAPALRQLDALFGKQLKTLKETAPAEKPVGVGAEAGGLGVTDDDVPF